MQQVSKQSNYGQTRVTLYRQALERGQSKPVCRSQLEKIVMGLILSLIVMVASINIIGMLILVVMTRRREIAIQEPWVLLYSDLFHIYIRGCHYWYCRNNDRYDFGIAWMYWSEKI